MVRIDKIVLRGVREYFCTAFHRLHHQAILGDRRAKRFIVVQVTIYAALFNTWTFLDKS